jgi:hypothetical protein
MGFSHGISLVKIPRNAVMELVDLLVQNENVDFSAPPFLKLRLQLCRRCAKLSFVRQTSEPTNLTPLGFGKWMGAHLLWA